MLSNHDRLHAVYMLINERLGDPDRLNDDGTSAYEAVRGWAESQGDPEALVGFASGAVDAFCELLLGTLGGSLPDAIEYTQGAMAINDVAQLGGGF